MIRNIGLPLFLIGLLDVCPLLAFRFWGAVLQLAPSKSWSNWSSSPKFQIWANDIGISKIIRRANYQMGSTDKRMDYYQRIHCCWLSWWNRPRKCPLYFYLLSHNRGLDGDLQPLENIFSWTDIRQPHQLLWEYTNNNFSAVSAHILKWIISLYCLRQNHPLSRISSALR